MRLGYAPCATELLNAADTGGRLFFSVQATAGVFSAGS